MRGYSIIIIRMENKFAVALGGCLVFAGIGALILPAFF